MHTMTANARAQAPFAVRPARRNRSVLRTVVTAFHVMNERARLARMDDHELADIGLTRDEANREAARPFWDLPVGR